MKRSSWSPYVGLVMTGITASVALLVEPRLQVSSDIHFFLQFLWVGVVGAALLAFALMPALNGVSVVSVGEVGVEPQAEIPEEFLDEDRLWLQNHPDSSWNEQA